MTATSRPVRQKPETLRLRRLSVGLTVNDLARSIRFYTEGLGFMIDQRWEMDGELRGVSLKAGMCHLNIGQDDWAKGKDRVKGQGMRISLNTVQDVDQLAARAKAQGITIDEGPKELPWGPRAFAVTDPDGFKLTIVHQE